VVTQEQSLYWFDYETFGISPAWDKPAQFAGIRTNMDLQPIDEPLLIYCKPPADYLPSPAACRVTHMHPQDIAAQGMSEPDFIQRVVEELGKPGTCSVGYNSIRFDDEFTRHTLFRNFHDPYEYEWKNGNSRWDLLDVVRLARALRPDGLNWPVLDDGTPVNKLELITVLNGIEHANAHDALADVEATIEVARLIKQYQPKLYDYAFTNRDKKSVAEMLNVKRRKPCIQISGMIPSEHGHAAIVVPVARHPINQNGVIVLDLRTDPDELFSLDAKAIAARVFAKNEDLGDKTRINLRTIQINKCPVLVPTGTMRETDAARLGIDLPEQLERAKRFELRYTDEFAEKIRKALTREWDQTSDDVDGTLYSGSFFSADDKQRFAQIRLSSPDKLAQLQGLFDDPRADKMLFRYRARNFPETLNADEQAIWQHSIHERLNNDEAPWLSINQFYEEMKAIDWQADEHKLKQSLLSYADNVITRSVAGR
jgi:exodeoxyribonuclease-1